MLKGRTVLSQNHIVLQILASTLRGKGEKKKRREEKKKRKVR